MRKPLISVIIPAYDGGNVIGDAVRSVLDQTYANLELLVVDDCSPRSCVDVVEGFGDERVRFIRHGQNRGAQAARRTGLEASTGEIVFFLDQDDWYHPRKVERHVALLQANPDVGLTYNPHFTVLHPMGWVVGVWRPPAHVTLADLVLGFPIAPSVWVMRRQWAQRDELYDEAAMLRGAETVICGRLLAAGCRFAMVDQALNYRRHHVERIFSSPLAKCRDERRCQDIMFADPRCSARIASLRDAAAVGNFLVWANVAFAQGDAESGLELLEQALLLDAGLGQGVPSRLADFVLEHSLLEAADPETRLVTVFDQMTRLVPSLEGERAWAIGMMHLLRASQHLIWRRPADAEAHVERVRGLGWRADGHAYARLSYDLLCYELEFGRPAARAALRALGKGLKGLDGWSRSKLEATYPLARAFHADHCGHRIEVPLHVLRAFARYPRCAGNRGAWSLLLRSVLRRPGLHRGEAANDNDGLRGRVAARS